MTGGFDFGLFEDGIDGWVRLAVFEDLTGDGVHEGAAIVDGQRLGL